MNILHNQGYEVNEKVYIEGFSNMYFFAQRMTLLKPDWVKAIAGGGMCGSFVLPQSVYNSDGSPYDGRELPWSLGISNIEALVGYTFDDDAYKQVHQYVFNGSEDTNNTTVPPGGSEIYSAEDVDFILSEFGDKDPVILENVGNYMKDLGYENLLTEILPGLKHEYPNEQKAKAFKFLSQYMDVPDDSSPPEDPGTPDNGSSGGGSGCFIGSLK